MNDETYFQRIEAIARPGDLRITRVSVIGAGSGGSQVALELGRLGVNVLVIDRQGELLEPHNIVRHVLPATSLGKPKTTELAAHIRAYYSAANIEVADLDVVRDKEQLTARLAAFDPHVIASALDAEEPKHVVNEIALRLGKPVVSGAVYDGGIGGEVCITRPNKACYACIAHELKIERGVPASSAIDIDYGTGEHRARSASALNLDITQIATIQTRVILAMLLGQGAEVTGIPDEANVIVFGNRPVPGVVARPLHAEFFSIARNPSCLSCNHTPEAVAAAAEILAKL